jgi:small subunit ribosomal protein S6
VRERRRDYELLFIISPLQSSEEQLAAATQRVQQVVTAIGGEVTGSETSAPWGRRKFAYPIREYAEGEASRRNFAEGFYVLMHFSASPARLGELERSLKLNDAVLRYLLTLVEQRGKAAPALVAGEAAQSDDADSGGDDE